jgi:hypothetical protein
MNWEGFMKYAFVMGSGVMICISISIDWFRHSKVNGRWVIHGHADSMVIA